MITTLYVIAAVASLGTVLILGLTSEREIMKSFTIDTRHLSHQMYLNALSWDGKAWSGEGDNIYSPSENVRSWEPRTF